MHMTQVQSNYLAGHQPHLLHLPIASIHAVILQPHSYVSVEVADLCHHLDVLSSIGAPHVL